MTLTYSNTTGKLKSLVGSSKSLLTISEIRKSRKLDYLIIRIFISNSHKGFSYSDLTGSIFFLLHN